MMIGGMQVIAIYGGRFQPMGWHHRMTYEWMVKTFGYENSFIISAGTKTGPKDPLLFNEKKMVAMAHGIPEEKFIYEKVPYRWDTWVNIPAILATRGLKLENVLLFYVVGEKDMLTDPRLKPYFKKDGMPSYFQHYVQGMPVSVGTEHGYLAVAPHMEFILPNKKESSGTNLREFLVSANPMEFEDAMGFYDPNIDNMLKQKIKGVMMEGIKRRNRNDEGYGSYLEEIMNELQHIKKEFKSRTKEGKRYRKEASKIQDAYNELKFLKRKHERQIEMQNDQLISERAIRRATGFDDHPDCDQEFNRDSVREFFDKFK